MKKSFRIVVSVFLMLLILSVTGIVNGFSVNMELESSSKLKVGDTVQVTLKISNINAGDGIDAIGATLEYDKNVFEEVTQESFEGTNGWSLGIYSTNTQMLTILSASKVKTASEVLKVNLKVKNITNIDSTVIKFKDITAAGGSVADGGTGDIEISEAKITLSKEVSNEPIKNNTVVNNVANNVVNNVVNNAGVNKQNAVTGKIPYAGSEIGIGLLILIFVVISIVIYKKYRYLNIK